jgi:tRNA-dihydrouridine synthase B
MRIGKIDIERPVVLAPMEDVTDIAFRLVCRRLGADIVYTEFVNSEGLVRDTLKTKNKMLFVDEERPFGIQIYGGGEEAMERAASIAASYDPDIIDINCGCWVKDIAQRGAGAGLLRDLPRMERIVSNVVKAVKLPVTVKTRLGWDAESIRIVEVARMVEQTGARALTIHCRTRSQGHNGDPDFSWIPQVKAAVSIPIIVNGSLDSAEKIKKAFDETGCDGVMIGRAAIDNPWIFQQAKHFLKSGEQLPPPTIEQRVQILFEHLNLSVEHKGERKGTIEFRKHYAGYMRGLPNASKVRQELMQYTELPPIIDRIQQFVSSLQPSELPAASAA